MRSSVLELGLGGGVPIPNPDGRDARPPFDVKDRCYLSGNVA